VSHSALSTSTLPDSYHPLVVYVCPTCQEKTGRRTVSKCQKTTHAQQVHYPSFSFRIFCTLPSCNNPHLRLLVPVFVAIRLGTGTVPLRQPELHVPHPRPRELHTSSLNDAFWPQRSQTRLAARYHRTVHL
jgi:hypothetical protein